jgi:hypothetical protein
MHNYKLKPGGMVYVEQEQKSPVNQAKHESANAALSRAGKILSAADLAVDNISNSTVQYSMDKQVKDRCNFIVGGQYQFDKHLMLRFGYGFLGSRTQVMTGVQYRLGYKRFTVRLPSELFSLLY